MEPIRVGEFAFTVRPGDPPNCVPVDKKWEPLAAVLTMAGEKIVDWVAIKTGFNQEGVVGFYWGDGLEPGDDLRTDQVRVHYFETSLVLDEAFFAEAAAAWARALKESR